MGEKASIRKRMKVNMIEYSVCVHENAIMKHTILCNQYLLIKY